MIRRPLTSIGLKPVDIDYMEACLQRKFKNEPNENDESSPMRRTRSGERISNFTSSRTTSSNNNAANNSTLSPNLPNQEEMPGPNEASSNHPSN